MSDRGGPGRLRPAGLHPLFGLSAVPTPVNGEEEQLPAIYLGIDVAGAKNTWMAGLSADVDSLLVRVEVCEGTTIVASAIRTQLMKYADWL
jgi:hypothetical protein